jgi:hypothetical protein
MIELLEQFDLIENVLLFLLAFVFNIHLLDDVLLFLSCMEPQICVTKCALSDDFKDFVL